MDKLSILLSLDGSVQSLYAARLCWRLALEREAEVTAQHVVDSLGLWEFLNREEPGGLIGSGPYMSAREVMREQLHAIGQTLLSAYETHAWSAGVDGEAVLDEGNTVREILRRSLDHHMTVIGHRASGISSPLDDRRKFARHSVAERVAHHCQRPVLIVQHEAPPISRIQIVLSVQSSFSHSLLGAVRLSRYLDCPAEILGWVQDSQEQGQLDRVLAMAFDDCDELEPSHVAVKLLECQASRWGPDIEVPEGTLLTVPASDSPHTRETPFGTPPELIVRYSQLPYLLIWPESYAMAALAKPGASRQSSSSSGI